MGFWAWFWIWTTLLVSSVAVLGIITVGLWNRFSEVLHQFERLAKNSEALQVAMVKPDDVARPEDNLLDDPAVLVAERRHLLTGKQKKHEARQRRLIESLKHFNPDESRFKK
ncbi:MAG: hypothetical protein RL716_465 [Actinomycetota bacterium]|jgi:hypothetical protein|uniref:hypothetical protein n=1 Tax=Rhodoluna sp. TaxID=1969481 RepID=UPI0025F4A1FE|nr:hypothetical protein [Rhodoluna sp.]